MGLFADDYIADFDAALDGGGSSQGNYTFNPAGNEFLALGDRGRCPDAESTSYSHSAAPDKSKIAEPLP